MDWSWLYCIFLTNEEIAAIPWEYPSIGEILLFIIGIVFFLFLNGFFVANEFAAARVRQSQLEPSTSDSKSEARKRGYALHIVKNLDSFLSANQVGITIASLALGSLGEPFIESLIKSPLIHFCHLSPTIVNVLSYTIAYALFTFAHVVLGELVPKSLAIRHPLQVSMATATGMMRFAKYTKWVILLFNNTANKIAQKLFGIDPHYEPDNCHSAEEIAHIVQESGRSNSVTKTEAEISMNALELNDRSVHDILVPRGRVEVLDINNSFEENLERVAHSSHSRFTIVKGHLDDVKGWIHVKDILTLVRNGCKDLVSMCRPIKVVPETMKLDTLLNFFSREHTHCALVVDEYGMVVGQVYLDDLLEEIVGDDILDEFEVDDAKEFLPTGKDCYTASGSIALFDLAEELPELGTLESDNGISTLGGYITDIIGNMPELNDEIRIRDYVLTVTGTDGRRVTQVKIEKIKLPQETLEEEL